MIGTKSGYSLADVEPGCQIGWMVGKWGSVGGEVEELAWAAGRTV